MYRNFKNLYREMLTECWQACIHSHLYDIITMTRTITTAIFGDGELKGYRNHCSQVIKSSH